MSRASLSEIMGKRASHKGAEGSLELADLPEILGEGMPHLTQDALGRHRLVRALKQRFGNNFRSLPGVGNLLTEFDAQTEFEAKLKKLKGFKAGGKNG